MIYVIILNYNNSTDTIECIDSLKTIVDTSFQIIVVDNHSVADQVALLKVNIQDKVNITLIENIKNSGFAGGCNLAIKFVIQADDYDYIWLLNNDTVVTANSLSAMIQTMQSNSLIGVCGSKIVDFTDKKMIQSLGGRISPLFATTSHIIHSSELNKLDYIVGASMLISKQCIKSVGLLSEDYFLYYEDVDYCLKVKEKNFLLGVSLESIVYHKEGGASVVREDNAKQRLFIDKLQVQNRKTFVRKFGFSKHGLYLGLIFSVFNRIRKGQYQYAISAFLLFFKDFNWKNDPFCR